MRLAESAEGVCGDSDIEASLTTEVINRKTARTRCFVEDHH